MKANFVFDLLMAYCAFTINGQAALGLFIIYLLFRSKWSLIQASPTARILDRVFGLRSSLTLKKKR